MGPGPRNLFKLLIFEPWILTLAFWAMDPKTLDFWTMGSQTLDFWVLDPETLNFRALDSLILDVLSCKL